MALFFVSAYITNQIDESAFEATASWWTDWKFKCYVSDELFRQNIRPSVGDLVILEADSDLKDIKGRYRYYIVKVL